MKNLSFTPVTLDGRSEFYELWRESPRRSLDYSACPISGAGSSISALQLGL